jgi:hypothetical protein
MANEWSVPHADVDDYFWVPSSPPYSVKRPVPSRLELMNEIFLPRDAWVKPVTKPGQVRLVKASPGRGTAIISWRLPANNGGSKITGYRVARNGRDTIGHGAYQTLVKPTKHAIKMTRLYKDG